MPPSSSASPQPRKGTFIVIEGTDGSGKGTQFKLLAGQLQHAGYDVALFDFPQYDEPSSYFVKKYLNGGYGSAEEVGPYTGSLFYALDRYDAASGIRQALQEGKVVLANRFTGSNMGHQGTKFSTAEQRRGYFIWLDNLEFETLGIPRPDLNVVLRVPAATAQQLVDQKAERSYTDKKRDLHEADLQHLERAVQVYDDLCELFPKDFSRIDCVRGGTLLSIEDVNKLVVEKVLPLLPPPSTPPALPGMEGAAISEPEAAASPSADTGAKAAPSLAATPPVAATTAMTPEPGTARLAAAAAAIAAANPADNPYVVKQDTGGNTVTSLTAAGREFLQGAVTDPEGNVYGFTNAFSPVTIAAAMARLSRRGDDMRITLMDEFAHAMGRDAQLLQRVITAYGDDSVQQLVGIPMVVENASNLLTKKLEWGRLAAYLEQSTRYIYFDQKDTAGKYKYHTPEHLDPATAKAYSQALDGIFERYSAMVRQLTDYVREQSGVPEAERDIAWKSATRAQACDAARAVLPVATKSTVGIYASGQALEMLIMRLLADDLPEARTTGESLLREARKVTPAFLERADKPERGGAAVAYLSNTRKAVRELARQHLPANHAASYTATSNIAATGNTPVGSNAPAPAASAADQAVSLTDVWPRNELDIVADILYEHSSLPLARLREEVEHWPYERKAEVLNAYVGERLNRRHKPGRALEKIHYSWDLVCDYGIFRDLQRHRMVDDLEWQELTPRHGYETPKLVSDAGLDDLFDECFDISLQLYSLLQKNGYDTEAQYATLLGHKMRWKVTYNAREAFHLHELRTSPQGHPGYRKLVSQMHDKVAAVHPILAQSMKFVNQGEDPELTRLAAERYTQFKLQRLQTLETPETQETA